MQELPKEADIPTERSKKDSTAPVTYSIKKGSYPAELTDLEPLRNAIINAISIAINSKQFRSTEVDTYIADTSYAELETAAANPKTPPKKRELAKLIVNTCRHSDLEKYASNAYADARFCILAGRYTPTGFPAPPSEEHPKPTSGIISWLRERLPSIIPFKTTHD